MEISDLQTQYTSLNVWAGNNVRVRHRELPLRVIWRQQLGTNTNTLLEVNVLTQPLPLSGKFIRIVDKTLVFGSSFKI